MSDYEPLQPGEDWAAWGARTGRYRPAQVPFYRAQLDASTRRILASAGPSAITDGGEAFIKSITAVFGSAAANPAVQMEDDREFGHLFAPTTVQPGADPIAAAGYRQPMVDASPPRSEGGYANGVEELRAQHPGQVKAAEAASPPPELFPGSGDYPVAAASEIDVDALSELPWRARLAAAWTPDRAAAFAMTQQYGGPDGEVQCHDLVNNAAVRDYTERVMHWFGAASLQGVPNADGGVRASVAVDDDWMTPQERARFFGPQG